MQLPLGLIRWKNLKVNRFVSLYHILERMTSDLGQHEGLIVLRKRHRCMGDSMGLNSLWECKWV
jgi:hypothetical protein